jgi:ubiquinone/menaquinone biosynthesis C-methylase UbiE
MTGRDSALDEARKRAERTYNAASDHYDAGPLGFWEHSGRRTIERLGLAPGARVLDVCCGTGASAIPAARAVGDGGSVIAVDLAEDLLALGRKKAEAACLRRLEFRRGDMSALEVEPASFDAVVCVFGIFFVPDMEAQVAELRRFVRPGGRLAITTWGAGIFSPAYAVWLDAVHRVRPDLDSGFSPWERITTTDAVRKLFADAGIADGVDVEEEAAEQSLSTPDDFWAIAMGSGCRWTIDRLGPAAADGVRREVTGELTRRGVERVSTNAIYAVAR